MPPAINCTHLFDLAWWSMAHAVRSETVCDYQVAVGDEDGAAAECIVWRNGQQVYHWRVAQAAVVLPQELCNKPMLQGFSSWAARRFKGDDFEAAVLLQRSYLVAQGRRHDLGAFAGRRTALVFPTHRGVCYSYSEGVFERATVANSQRDFTHTPELLLEFG